MTDAQGLPGELVLRYHCDLQALPAELRARFLRLELGDSGTAFVQEATRARRGRLRTTLQRMLRRFMSDFDANGLLGMYPMHLLGTEQWRALLPWVTGSRHLDVGAGSGDVTRTLRPLASETVTTETSKIMARNLRKQGYPCFEVDLADAGVPEPPYGLITCLNVIDRCARPATLLSHLARALTPGGTLVLATPFPFDPFVYSGSRSLAPAETLDIASTGPHAWELSVTKLADHVQRSLGLSIEAIARVPYLCQGDASRALYVLDDALLVCRSTHERSPTEQPGGQDIKQNPATHVD